MKKEIRLAPRNSLIFVMDQSIGKIPQWTNDALVVASPSCIAIGTLCEIDGETLISLSDETPPLSSDMFLAFDRVVATPALEISVCSVLDKALITLDVSGKSTRVQVWANDASEPDRICIVARPEGM